MARKKKSSIPRVRVEVLIILIFFLSFIVWAISKCNATKKLFQQEDDNETAALVDTVPIVPEAALTNVPRSEHSIQQGNMPVTSVNGGSRLSNPDYSKLYVLIEGLNLRTGPRRDCTAIAQIPLYEEVYFLNEVTDSTEQINMGTYIANEPWVKVRQRKGQEGWVYGAGVHYYIRK